MTPPTPLPRAPLAAALAIAAMALLAPLLASSRPGSPVPYAPEATDLSSHLEPPSTRHWLGTDELGRDILSRLIHGARVSVAAGALAASLALILGATLGGAAGMGGGRVDSAVRYLIDVVQAFPPLVLVAAGSAFLPPSFATAPILIALTGWTDAARLVRAEARRTRAAPFVEAARAVGASRGRILFRHVLPHALPPALATLPYVLGAAVVTEASLSFLGLGTPPPTPSWGRSLAAAADARTTLGEAWWCLLPPALALLVFVLSVRRLGDALTEGRLESRPL